MKRIQSLFKKDSEHNLKKGMTSLEIVIAVLVSLVAFCGFIDMSNIMTRINVLSENTGYVARVTGKQGGIRQEKIDNFAGVYVTSEQLYQNVKQSMNSVGVTDEEWKVYIGNQLLTPASNFPVKDYGSELEVRVVVDYEWTLTRHFIPLPMKGQKESTGHVYTTHKIRNADYH